MAWIRPLPQRPLELRKSEDLLAALDFLRTIKGDAQNPLVGDRFGVYGVELGAYAAMRAANKDTRIQALVLDSIPRRRR